MLDYMLIYLTDLSRNRLNSVSMRKRFLNILNKIKYLDSWVGSKYHLSKNRVKKKETYGKECL